MLIQHLLRILPCRLIGNASLAPVEIAAHIAPYHGTETRAFEAGETLVISLP